MYREYNKTLLFFLLWIFVGGVLKATIKSVEVVVVVLFILPLVYFRVESRPLSFYGLTLKRAPLNIIEGLLLGLTTSLSAWVIAFTLGSILVHGTSSLDTFRTLRLTLWFLVVASLEEVVFRGIIFNVTVKASNVKMATLYSSLLFSIAHIFNPQASIVALLNLFLGGVVLGLLVYLRSSLLPAIFFHTSWNLTLTILGSPVSGISYGESVVEYEAIETLISGGGFGLEGGLASTITLGLIALILTLKVGIAKFYK